MKKAGMKKKELPPDLADWRAQGFADAMSAHNAEDIRDLLISLRDCFDVFQRAAEHDLHARRLLGMARAYFHRRGLFLDLYRDVWED